MLDLELLMRRRAAGLTADQKQKISSAAGWCARTWRRSCSTSP